jgi:hypothetical protein
MIGSILDFNEMETRVRIGGGNVELGIVWVSIGININIGECDCPRSGLGEESSEKDFFA